MNIERLLLQEFRSYRDLELRLPAAGVRLVGANASGKSSLVEAIGMLATTRSPRTSTEREVINWASGEEIGFPPFARMLTDVVRATGNVQIEIGLQVEGGTTKSVKKQIKLNGRAVRGMDAVGALKAVLFSPEDVAMVAGPPSGRRRFLDVAISQIDGFYLRALSQLARLLSQRNSLLKTLGRDNLTVGSPRVDAQLDFWDRELSAIGAAIMARRQQTVARLDILAQQRFAALSGQDGFRVTYVPSFTL
ncbi:MAG: AAA family ATPase, partial [Thermomicrobiales bacterium]